MRDLNDGFAEERGPEDRGGAAAWSRAGLAAALLAVDPVRLGGAILRARPGHARDAWIEVLRSLLPAGSAWHRLPPGTGARPLSSALDLAATLAEGRRVEAPGLLARAAGGVLVIPGAERLERTAAGLIAQARDASAGAVSHSGRIGVDAPLILALDEGAEEEERAPGGLRDRLAFHLPLDGIAAGEVAPPAATAEEVADARCRLATVEMPPALIEAAVGVASSMGIASARPAVMALAAARAHAALSGRQAVEEADLALAVELVLLPRALWLPGEEEVEAETPPPADDAPPPQDETSSEDTSPPEQEVEALEDRLLDAVRAALPPALLAALLAGNRQRSGSNATGAAGAFMATPRRGRPAGVRPGLPGGHRRLALVETLSAAAPWQPLRKQARDTAASSRGSAAVLGDPPADAERRLELRRDDLRIRRFKAPRETLTVFAVDASGSAAIARLAEAKGAVELLLAEAYRRRDSVALVAFRKSAAEVLLPPTRALARARKALAALPGGGGTPLAAGLDAARLLAEGARRRGMSVSVVLLSDGRANVARDGSPGRAEAQADAVAAGRALALTGAATLVIDTSAAGARRARPEALALAEAMAARYLALPGVGAEGIAAAATALTGGGARGAAR
ncbi:MAG: magnesium chelatase subunit D [Pseudomonadota bacterium]